MRNPERITLILDLVGALWRTYPDMRFNQLIDYLQTQYASTTGQGQEELFRQETLPHGGVLYFPKSSVDLFNVEDDAFLDFLKREILKQLPSD